MVVVSGKQPLHPQSFLGTLQMNPFFKSSGNFAKRRSKTTLHLCKLVIIVVEKLVVIDAVPKIRCIMFSTKRI
ncbi:hypothetical protein EJD97_020283 [Solanum chilense]|uniref:Uncharacterized protein n=1 Tax=Solanum chilense TaxID=4083 RepID=A0A6N2AGD6_SOLCI|nr:hypothetical protein EJD97_020283 [Solanum chilense]